jgi:MFS family permease
MTSKKETVHVETLGVDEVEIAKNQILKGLDEAQKIIGHGDTDIDATPEEIRKLIWKTDFLILPMLAVCYVFFFVDKTSLSYSAIFGIKDDLQLQGTEYNWLSAIFYFGYLAWAVPTNIMLLKFPVAKYLGVNIFLWGVFLMCQGACKSFATLCVLRALGGAAEACADPAFMLITSMWYTRKEQPIRIGLWYTANGFGIAVGGLVGYGIGHLKSSLPSWRYEFIIIGACCAVWGIVVFLFLPDSPVKNRYFTEREKRTIILRLQENQTGIETKVFKWKQAKEALMDPKTYAFFLITMFANIPNGGLSEPSLSKDLAFRPWLLL